MSAVNNGCCNRGGGGEFGFESHLPSQKMFARRAHHDRQIEARKFVQTREDFRILLLALPEAKTRIDHDALALQSLAHGAMHGRIEFHGQVRHGILQRRKLGPRFRRTAHVINNQTGVGLCGGARDLRVGGEAGRIVNDIRSQFQGFRRHAGFISIDRERHGEPPLQALQDGNESAKFLGLRNTNGAGTHRFRTNVDDVGALFLQFHGAREGAVGIAVFSAVGKRIGRDVENPHHERTFAQLEGFISNFPFVKLAGHSRLFLSYARGTQQGGFSRIALGSVRPEIAHTAASK